jgi:hypothetical protein
MGSRPSPASPDSGPGQAGATLAVATLEKGSGLAELLAGTDGVSVRSVATLDELARLVEAGAADAAIVDPELGDGWPTDVGRMAAERLHGRVPLLLVCRSARDAAVLEGRVEGYSAVVLLRDRLAAGDLAAVLVGEVTRRQAALRSRRD